MGELDKYIEQKAGIHSEPIQYFQALEELFDKHLALRVAYSILAEDSTKIEELQSENESLRSIVAHQRNNYQRLLSYIKEPQRDHS